MGDWIGTNNREVHCAPLLDFRQTLQSMGLLRKHKGTLLLTRAGAAAQRDPAKLWDHLAMRLVPGGDDSFEGQATLLLLAYAGSSDNSELPLDQVAMALTELGWRHSDGAAGKWILALPCARIRRTDQHLRPPNILGQATSHQSRRGHFGTGSATSPSLTQIRLRANAFGHLTNASP